MMACARAWSTVNLRIIFGIARAGASFFLMGMETSVTVGTSCRNECKGREVHSTRTAERFFARAQAPRRTSSDRALLVAVPVRKLLGDGEGV